MASDSKEALICEMLRVTLRTWGLTWPVATAPPLRVPHPISATSPTLVRAPRLDWPPRLGCPPRRGWPPLFVWNHLVDTAQEWSEAETDAVEADRGECVLDDINTIHFITSRSQIENYELTGKTLTCPTSKTWQREFKSQYIGRGTTQKEIFSIFDQKTSWRFWMNLSVNT